MAIKRIDLIWVTVSDFERSKNFFEEKLGLAINSNNEEYGWLEVTGEDGGAVLGVATVADKNGPEKPGQNAVITFTVDDIDEEKKKLEGRGINFVGDILEVPGHVKMINFVDEDNNKYQLVEDLPEDDEDCEEDCCDINFENDEEGTEE